MISFETITGSTYLIDDSGEPWRVCRAASTHDLRQDGAWHELVNKPSIDLGFSVTLVMPVLDPPLLEGAEVTARMTSQVTRVSYS